MEKLRAGQKPDTLGHNATHQAIRDLTQQELDTVSGGDGPPSTAGDGNGRVAFRID